LSDGLRAAGFRLSDIRRIVLTHAHEDHCGLARAVRDEAKNAEVLVHDWETGHRHSRLEYEEHRQLLVRAGVPDNEIEVMRRMYEGVRQYSDSLDDNHCTPLWDVDCRRLRVEAHHAKSGAVAGSVESSEAFSFAGGVSRESGAVACVFADAGLRWAWGSGA
jgi:glyoxylase-like metal-dependent hydrolase (beta-lactamase superfamily II)